MRPEAFCFFRQKARLSAPKLHALPKNSHRRKKTLLRIRMALCPGKNRKFRKLPHAFFFGKPEERYLPEDPRRRWDQKLPVNTQKTGQSVFCGLRPQKIKTFPVLKPYELQPADLSVRSVYGFYLRFDHFSAAGPYLLASSSSAS